MINAQSSRTKTYEDIVFLFDHHANEAFAMLDLHDEMAAMDYLKQWHYPGEHPMA